MGLSRDEVLSKNVLPIVLVKVPEWGGDVYVKTLPGKERDAFEYAGLARRRKAEEAGEDFTPENVRARMVVATACNEKGELLFTEKDIDVVGALSCAALDRLWEAASKLNRFTKEDAEEIAKN